MAIKTEKTITEDDQSLELFADRFDERRLFASYLNDDPPRETVLFFHGDGGNGKSLLLKLLRKKYCRRLPAESWAYVKEFRADAFVEQFEEAPNFVDIPHAYLDFGAPDRGEDRPREDFAALLMLRRELGAKKLNFPLFDLSILLYLIKTHQFSPDGLKSLFPQEEMGLLTDLVDAISQSPYASLARAVLNLFNKHLKGQFAHYRLTRNLDEAAITKLQGMEPRSELRDAMPQLFARDLNSAMQMQMQLSDAPHRLVLFFDTHEAFWGTERAQQSFESYFQRDKWLRRLLSELYAPNYGVVVVIAGRKPPSEPPGWADAGDFPIAEKYIDRQLIGHLERHDAEYYLTRAGVADPFMRTAIIDYTEVLPNQVHPLYLGMCADIVLTARESEQELTPESFTDASETSAKGRKLITRLLRYCPEVMAAAVKALAAARAFDRNLFFELGQALHYDATSAAFDQLTRFSFIWREGRRGTGWYRIHDLLRRLLWELNEAETAEANTVLEAHYRQKHAHGDALAIVEAIYHLSRRNGQWGVQEWVQTFRPALKSSQYVLCEALLNLRPDLLITSPSSRGDVALCEGDFGQEVARHSVARVAYKQAIDAYDEALKRAPNDAGTNNDRGLALMRLGELLAALSEHDAARKTYEQAIAAYDNALKRAPNDAGTNNDRGLALTRLGELLAALSEHDAARKTYEQAIAAYDKALRRAPNAAGTHNNRGLALTRVGELLAALNEHDAARKTYEQAIAAYDKALKCNPDLVEPHNNRGLALGTLGNLLAAGNEHNAARKTYEQAIAAYDEALKRAPDFVMIHNNRGPVLQDLGDLFATLGQYDAAQKSYEQAIASYDEALKRAPDFIVSHNNRGGTLSRLGNLLAARNEHDAARKTYEQAIAAYDEALKQAPNDFLIPTNRSGVLQHLGVLLAALGEYDAARQACQDAIAGYDEALKRAPNDVRLRLHKNRGLGLARLGDLLAVEDKHDAAQNAYEQAIAAYDEALKRAPNDVESHTNRSGVLQNLGDLFATLSQYDAARQNYQDAIAACDEALKRTPDQVRSHNNRGTALARLGGLLAVLSEHDAARKAYEQAIAAFDEALKRAPNDVRSHNNRGLALAHLGELPQPPQSVA